MKSTMNGTKLTHFSMMYDHVTLPVPDRQATTGYMNTQSHRNTLTCHGFRLNLLIIFITLAFTANIGI